ncbi:hypothetical protein RSAG8_13709, partial [Rhizoctonia solani AG-8 WAC10335]
MPRQHAYEWHPWIGILAETELHLPRPAMSKVSVWLRLCLFPYI